MINESCASKKLSENVLTIENVVATSTDKELKVKKRKFLKDLVTQLSCVENGGPLETASVLLGSRVNNVHRYTVMLNDHGTECDFIARTRLIEKNDLKVFPNLDDNIGMSLNFNKDVPKIILILESPHKDEYKDKQAINPANGPTGAKIQGYLGYLVKKIYDELLNKKAKINKKYDFCIVNPVPYQASFGVSTKYVRNEVWTLLWENECLELKDNFLKPPSLVIWRFLIFYKSDCKSFFLSNLKKLFIK